MALRECAHQSAANAEESRVHHGLDTTLRGRVTDAGCVVTGKRASGQERDIHLAPIVYTVFPQDALNNEVQPNGDAPGPNEVIVPAGTSFGDSGHERGPLGRWNLAVALNQCAETRLGIGCDHATAYETTNADVSA
jgi:hypothetical protein